MLLFSTILDIDESLTKDKFIRLVIAWNQESPHSENVIPEINWNGERNIRFGIADHWLEVEEYRNRDIIAVRYEKVEQDGIVWNTDYIMNFKDMRMAIQLDRSYKEEALIVDSKFSTPHFITTLIENGYLKADGKLPVLREPIYITEDNCEILTDIINNRRKYRLPVVYVSKTVFDHDPVNVRWLSSRLKGVAHVLVEDKKQLNYKIRKECNDNNEYNGSIGIYYPNSAIKNKRFLYRKYTGSDSILLDKVVKTVIQYANSQNVDSLYTWQGVSNALLSDRLNSQREERFNAESARQRAEDEVGKVYDTFDEDLKRLQQQVEELTKQNEAFRCENHGLRAKLNEIEAVPILVFGDEDEFYPGEIKDLVLSILEEALNNTAKKSRKADVLRDIIGSNDYQYLGKDRKSKVKNLLKGYNGMTGSIRQQLLALGFEITEDGKHYKLIYYGDNRYWTTLAKTPGDSNHGDKNIINEIIKAML